MASGMNDPIAFYKAGVLKLNQELKQTKLLEKQRQISNEIPKKLIGYFPFKNISDSLGVKNISTLCNP